VRFLKALIVAVAVSVGLTLLATMWIFMLTGFGGLIFLYQHVSPWSVGILVLLPALGYSATRTIRSRT
jgi:hypothetical protein